MKINLEEQTQSYDGKDRKKILVSLFEHFKDRMINTWLVLTRTMASFLLFIYVMGYDLERSPYEFEIQYISSIIFISVIVLLLLFIVLKAIVIDKTYYPPALFKRLVQPSLIIAFFSFIPHLNITSLSMYCELYCNLLLFFLIIYICIFFIFAYIRLRKKVE